MQSSLSHTVGVAAPHPGVTNLAGDLLQSSFDRPALNLIVKLCQALADEDIVYCHWKSNNALDRSASGENDLDLLVSRSEMSRFIELLTRLAFKLAQTPPEKRMPGVVDYFGYDKEADKLVHVHVHYQLFMGHDMTKNYRLPIEKPFLESAERGELFPVPSAAFEFIVFIIRMNLKHSTWDAILGGAGALKATERKELAFLQAQANRNSILDILIRHLPYIGVELFDDCTRALEPGCSIWRRVNTGHQLQARLQANSRRPASVDAYLKVWRRAALAVRRRVFKFPSKYRLEGGGALIAVVGGDGAGKSTAVDGLYDWLSKYFATTRIHLGKPDWSLTTRTVRGILKVGQLAGLYPLESTYRETLNQKSIVSPGYPWLLREVCRARDRYNTYVKARRIAANDGLVIFDRFPVPQVRQMDGPLAGQFVDRLAAGSHGDQLLSPRPGGRLTNYLIGLEEKYYQSFTPPDLLIVLRVDPKIAVQRKVDEDASSVRERSSEIWGLNWERTGARVIDSGKTKSEVLAELKTLIWSEL